jgi:hypothetical protein
MSMCAVGNKHVYSGASEVAIDFGTMEQLTAPDKFRSISSFWNKPFKSEMHISHLDAHQGAQHGHRVWLCSMALHKEIEQRKTDNLVVPNPLQYSQQRLVGGARNSK